jgi:hypothetical protein
VAQILIAVHANADTLTVGPDRQFPSPSEAAHAAHDGDTVRIEPGAYYDCAIWSQNHLTISGTGPGVVITDTTCQGKALFIVAGNDVTITDLTLARARVPDRNGAGIRLEGQGLTLERVRFLNDEVGLLAGAGGASTINISDCDFEDGGVGGQRPTFAVLVGEIKLLRIAHSTFNGVKGGQISTGAALTELLGNRINTGAGEAPAVAVMVAGGGMIAEDNLFSIGPNVPRPATAVLAMGTGPLRMQHNRMENETGQTLTLLLDWTGTDPVVLDNEVSRGDRTLSRSGIWRHRASVAYHSTKDKLHSFAGTIKRGLLAFLGR